LYVYEALHYLANKNFTVTMINKSVVRDTANIQLL
jgi:hypothetical protein